MISTEVTQTQIYQISAPPVSKKLGPILPAAQAKKFRFDFLKSLEPGKKKITTLEAQRIFSVIEETIKKIEIIALLDVAFNKADELSAAFGSHLTMLLDQHRVLLESYQELEEQKLQISQQINDERSSSNYVSSEEDIQRNMELQLKQISISIKNIIRGFVSNPIAIRAVMDFKDLISPEFSDLFVVFRELKESLFDRLSTTPLEEQEHADLAAWLSEQTTQLALNSERLEKELREAEQARQSLVKAKNEEIRQIQQQIHNLEKFSEDNVRKLKNEAEKQGQSDTKNSENRQQKLQQEVTSLKTRLQQSISHHRDVEFQLRKKKFMLESEVESWIGKYDSDMGERQAEFEEVERVYKEEKSQLEELEERFKKLEEEYRQIMEERRIEQEQKDEAERVYQASLKAALIIQAYWRGYKVRKVIRGKMKKGKGKGSKKGTGKRK